MGARERGWIHTVGFAPDSRHSLPTALQARICQVVDRSLTRVCSLRELHGRRRFPTLLFHLVERLARKVNGEGPIMRSEGVQVSE